MINSIIPKAVLGLGVIGTGVTATVSLALQKSSANSIDSRETNDYLESKCTGLGENYDTCVKELIPQSDSARKELEEQNRKAREGKEGLSLDGFTKKQKEDCGGNPYSESSKINEKGYDLEKWTTCSTSLSDKYYLQQH